MHVCDVTMFYSAHSGGIRRYLLEKRRWLQTRPGCRHSLVVPRRAASDGEPTVEVPSLPLPFASGYRLPLARNAAARALVKLGPQLIEAGDPYRLAWAALDAGEILGVPVIGFHHSDVPRILGRVCGPRAERLAEAYLRRLYARFTRVLAPSICMVERLRELDIQHVEHQPLGVDTRVFRPLHPLSRHRDLWRTHLGAGSGERLLVFVGRFAPEKNLPLLYAMMDRLGPGYLLVLVGHGTPPPSRRDVRVVSYIREPARLASLVAACDVFVHAGDQETFGLAPLEAMACGLPVVAARAGGLAELVDGSVGRAVPADDWNTLVTGMAHAVRELAADGLQSLRQAARRRAESYDWELILPAIAARYAALGQPAARERWA